MAWGDVRAYCKDEFLVNLLISFVFHRFLTATGKGRTQGAGAIAGCGEIAGEVFGGAVGASWGGTLGSIAGRLLGPKVGASVGSLVARWTGKVEAQNKLMDG